MTQGTDGAVHLGGVPIEVMKPDADAVQRIADGLVKVYPMLVNETDRLAREEDVVPLTEVCGLALQLSRSDDIDELEVQHVTSGVEPSGHLVTGQTAYILLSSQFMRHIYEDHSEYCAYLNRVTEDPTMIALLDEVNAAYEASSPLRPRGVG